MAKIRIELSDDELEELKDLVEGWIERIEKIIDNAEEENEEREIKDH